MTVTVLDGGMGHLLQRLGVEIKGELGSTQRFLGVSLANRDQSELVVQAHRSYLAVGSTVITTNSYSCVPRCLSRCPHHHDGTDSTTLSSTQSLVADLITLSVSLAKRAIAEHGNRARCAGCVPPLGHSYKTDADSAPTWPEMERDYATIVNCLVKNEVDILLVETMASVNQASCAARACMQADCPSIPVWVAFTIVEEDSGSCSTSALLADSGDDKESVRHTPRLRSGETLSEAAAKMFELFFGRENTGAPLGALIVNCSAPSALAMAIEELKEERASAALRFRGRGVEAVEIGCSPNAFAQHTEAYDGALTPALFAKESLQWRSAGATILGGCCGIFPEHIHALVESVETSNPEP